jgi:predicted nucleic acid-binding protein
VTDPVIGQSARSRDTLAGVKARVYLETTVISYLVGWLNQHDLYVAAQQEYTREWWTNQRQAYQLFASAVVVKEAREGKPELAAARLAFLEETTLLEVTDAADQLKSELLRYAALPRKAELDALHIAVAAVHGLDYLLSWNCKHIANGVTLPKVYAICRSAGYEPPFVCTPFELKEGQQ